MIFFSPLHVMGPNFPAMWLGLVTVKIAEVLHTTGWPASEVPPSDVPHASLQIDANRPRELTIYLLRKSGYGMEGSGVSKS